MTSKIAEQIIKRKTLVLDLDETLIHSIYTGMQTKKKNKITSKPDFVFRVRFVSF